jgi:hypothetical protein
MKKQLISCLALILAAACTPPGASPQLPRPNPAHLNYLTVESTVAGQRLGTVWIYCEAPDYHYVGDEDEGYTCVDDVARALVFHCRQQRTDPTAERLDRIRSLASFVLHLRAENGYFHNFLLPGGQVNTTHPNSVAIPGFWTWRACWALSELLLVQDESLDSLQADVLPILTAFADRLPDLCPSPADTAVFDGVALPACLAEIGADQAGVILLWLTNLHQRLPSDGLAARMADFGKLLLRSQFGDARTPPYHAFLSWRNHWHAWGNTQAYALLRAGEALRYPPFLDAGLAEVRHFYPFLLEKGLLHEFRLTKEAGTIALADEQPFPQIAYDISPMVMASAEAYRITGEPEFMDTAQRLAAWFRGDNPAGIAMYDPSTGRCFDGITAPKQVNRNAGAESTIEALLALQAMQTLQRPAEPRTQ